MLVIVHHNISDPKSFWAAAEAVTGQLPANLKVQAVFPSADAKTGTCFWEADNVQDVQDFLDKNAGQFAKNFCYEVNTEKAMGLPNFHLAEAQMS